MRYLIGSNVFNCINKWQFLARIKTYSYYISYYRIEIRNLDAGVTNNDCGGKLTMQFLANFIVKTFNNFVDILFSIWKADKRLHKEVYNNMHTRRPHLTCGNMK